ncbi:MAG: NAD(P)-dependent oxidoreductase [Rhodobacteraceae bacterium]|nr:NAD(P)-dependent oxidoreductase [Paracoccaceae bacterium]
MQVTLIGTGLMGFPMSLNLLKAGFSLTVWNRTIPKAQPLADHGAHVAAGVADATAGAEVVISIVADGSAVSALLDEAQLKEGALWIDMSSAKPGESRDHASALAERGVAHLDAPVSGGTKGAEGATLAIMVGGDQATFDRAVPVLEAMGRPVLVGPSGAGQLSKLANQAIVAVTIGAVAEATLLLEQGGADANAVRDALKGGFADSTILQQHGARMSRRDFVPGGLSKFQLKDLDNVLNEAEGAGISLPTVQAIRDRFETFCTEMEGGDQDHSGLFLELMRRNGL